MVVSAFVLRGRLRDAPWWSFFSWGWREPASWWQAFRYEGREWRAPTAMVDLAKKLEVPGRRICVLAAPGDRRDEDVGLARD